MKITRKSFLRWSSAATAAAITRSRFLRWSTAATAAAALEAAMTGCGGGGGGDGGGGSASAPAPSSVGNNGAWSNPATWLGAVPTSADAVTIGAGQTVTLDTTAAVCKSLDIQGTLLAATGADIALTTGNVNVGSGGVWTIGTTGTPFPAAFNCTITLNGTESSRATRNVSGTNLGFTNSGVGRSIQVQPGGTLNFIGTAPSIKRTKLDAHAASSATSFTLADTTGWKAGDEIAIGTTDFYGVSSSEKLVLSGNATGTGINTTSGITASRWGVLQYVTDTGMTTSSVATRTTPPAGSPVLAANILDQRAFVVHLTRNIVIQGANDGAWTGSKFGAHMMFMGRTSNIKLDGVQLRRVGQAGAIGRYPIHWHMVSYNMPSGMNSPSNGTFLGAALNNQYVKNCAIEQSSQRMIVVHGTHGVTLDANVGFDITGHAIFLEDGSEQSNVITNNVVLKVRAPTGTNKLYNHDTAAGAIGTGGIGLTGTNGTSGIWLSNPQNTVSNNWVNDAEGTGIWNTFATQCFNLSASVAINPNTTAFTEWKNNVAYGCKGVGIQTNRPMLNDRGDTSDSTTYQASFFSTPVIGATSFKNGAGGYSNRVKEAKYQGFISSDNAGMDVFGQAQSNISIGQGFLTIAESLNNANSRFTSSRRAAFASYHELLNFNNSIAVGYSYIHTSPDLVDDRSTAIGGGLFRLDDLYTDSIFTFSLNTSLKLINCTAPYRAKSPNIDGNPLSIASQPGKYRNWALAGAIKDTNGIFLGAANAGKYWVYDVPFLSFGAASPVNVEYGADTAGSNGIYTSDRYFGIGNFNHTSDSGLDFYFYLPLTVTRQDPSDTSLSGTNVTNGVWTIGDGNLAPFLGHLRHFTAKNGGRYKLQFPGYIANTVVQFNVNLMDDPTDIFLIGVEFSGSVTAKVFQRAQQFTSYTINVPHSPGNSSISRVLTSTGSFANVVADSTGTIFYQDTASNMVWFKVKTGGLALANTYSDPRDNVYKPVSIAVTS
jgi:hypothetical protein